MIAKCPCQHCGQHLEFEADDLAPSTTIPCPDCGQPTLLQIPTRSAEHRSAAPAPNKAGKIIKYDSFGSGALVQLLGAVLCITIIGAIIGIPLIIIGSGMSRKIKCGNCGNPIADKSVKLCPVCRAQTA